MNGPQDIGGMHGFGPIDHEDNEPVFHHEWEGRFMGIRRMLPIINLDTWRHTIESLPPSLYYGTPYYERWLTAYEPLLAREGIVSPEELDARTQHFQQHPEAQPERREDPERAARARDQLLHRDRLDREVSAPPRFAAGDQVRTKNVHPKHHTRLPRYARDKRGTVVRWHGAHDFPDTNAHGQGPQPGHVYSVQFEGSELWGPSAEPNQKLYLDLWETYLEPAG
jgi:nitrile hydratase beta subunit